MYLVGHNNINVIHVIVRVKLRFYLHKPVNITICLPKMIYDTCEKLKLIFLNILGLDSY